MESDAEKRARLLREIGVPYEAFDATGVRVELIAAESCVYTEGTYYCPGEYMGNDREGCKVAVALALTGIRQGREETGIAMDSLVAYQCGSGEQVVATYGAGWLVRFFVIQDEVELEEYRFHW